MLKIFDRFGMTASDADIRFPHFVPGRPVVFGYGAKYPVIWCLFANSL
jgi:hypothetical protein